MGSTRGQQSDIRYLSTRLVEPTSGVRRFGAQRGLGHFGACGLVLIWRDAGQVWDKRWRRCGSARQQQGERR